MDMDVSTELFEGLRGSINSSINAMNNASYDLQGATACAIASLEGELFSLGFHTSDAARQIIDNVASNAQVMLGYIDKLEDAVKSYLQCKYEG